MGLDCETVSAAQRGDRDAFAALAVASGGRLHGVAQRILRDPAAVDDATQNALLTIWRDLPQLRDLDRFEAWSYRVLVRSCLAEARRVRRGRVVRLLPRGTSSTSEDVEAVLHRDALDRAFRRLTVDHRAVVVLHHYLDLSLDEVAATLEVSLGTVRSRLYHAMRALRAAVEADARPMAEVVRW